jgi:hypothetical protein
MGRGSSSGTGYRVEVRDTHYTAAHPHQLVGDQPTVAPEAASLPASA